MTTTSTEHSGLQSAAIAVSSAVVLLPVTIAKIVEAILKSANPDGVDITQPLAYLQPILIAGWVTLGVCLVAAVALNIMVQRRGGSARFGWVALAVQLVLGAVWLLAQSAVD